MNTADFISVVPSPAVNVVSMMTSSNGNIFRVASPLCRRFTGHRWIPLTKAMTRSFDVLSNHQPHDCFLNLLFRRRSKKTSKLHVTGFCEGNSPVTGEFPAQMASDAENVSIWWRYHMVRRNLFQISIWLTSYWQFAWCLELNLAPGHLQTSWFLVPSMSVHIRVVALLLTQWLPFCRWHFTSCAKVCGFKFHWNWLPSILTSDVTSLCHITLM